MVPPAGHIPPAGAGPPIPILTGVGRQGQFYHPVGGGGGDPNRPAAIVVGAAVGGGPPPPMLQFVAPIPTVASASEGVWRALSDGPVAGEDGGFGFGGVGVGVGVVGVGVGPDRDLRRDGARAASALRSLRRAILSEAGEEAEEEDDDGETEGGMMMGGGPSYRRQPPAGAASSEPYDPAEAFLCVQGAALRCRARWEERMQERKRRKRGGGGGRMMASAGGGVAGGSGGVGRDGGGGGCPDDEELSASDGTSSLGGSESESGSDLGSSSSDGAADEEEQSAFDVYDEALRTAASLARTCVGPAWRHQLRVRREWTERGTTGLLPERGGDRGGGGGGDGGDGGRRSGGRGGRSGRRRRRRRADRGGSGGNAGGNANNDDGGSVSTLGMGSANFDWRQRLFSGGNQASFSDDEDDLDDSCSSAGSNPQSAGRFLRPRQPRYPMIPEVLPAAMLRFAASVGDMALTPVRGPRDAVAVERSEDGSPSPADVAELVWEEQRVLIRRQRIGEAQRELALALCCGDPPPSEQGGGEGGAGTGDAGAGAAQRGWEWTIPGAHAPVASMVRSWVETATASWPTERFGPGEGGSDSGGDYDASSDSLSSGDGGSSITSSVGSEPSLAGARGEEGEGTSAPALEGSVPRDVAPSAAPPRGREGGAQDGGGGGTAPPAPEGGGPFSPPSSAPADSTDAPRSEAASSSGGEVPDGPAAGVGPAPLDPAPEPDLTWADVARIGAVDWWFALQVSRAAADLVAAGWRPPPRGPAGEGCVSGLLNIAERGLLLRPSDLRSCPDATDREAREERLAASSSAAEAMCALASLGGRGHLPIAAVPGAVGALCGLLAAADPAMSSVSAVTLYPLDDHPADAEEDEEWRLERETFLNQRESCLSDVAELLWSLVADGRTACPASVALLKTMEVDLSPQGDGETPLLGVALTGRTDRSINMLRDDTDGVEFDSDSLPVTLHQGEDQDHAILAAGGGIRALGAALWGNPPQVKGVPSLRIYWCMLLEQLAKVAASIYGPKRPPDSSSPSPAPTGDSHRMVRRMLSAPHRTTVIAPAFGPLPCPCQLPLSSLVVLLEVAVALRRLVDGEMADGDPRSSCLSPIEWDPFIDVLEALVPWLDLASDPDPQGVGGCAFVGRRDGFLCRRIAAEAGAIFDRAEAFLVSSDRADDGGLAFHPVVDDVCRLRLHRLFLRGACPVLPPVRAAGAAISVVRSWMVGGFISHRGDEWTKMSSDLLAETFAVYDGDEGECGYPDGASRRYVHPPSVRLEALRAAACDDGGTDEDFLNAVVEASHSSATDTLNSIRGNMKSSRLDLAQTARELQLERVGNVLLPRLREVLGSGGTGGGGGAGAGASSNKGGLGARGGRFRDEVVLAVPARRTCPRAHCTDGAQMPHPGGSDRPRLGEGVRIDRKDEVAIAELYALRRYSVRLLGKMFRSLTSERQHRPMVIDLLRTVAMGSNGTDPASPGLHCRERDGGKDQDIALIVTVGLVFQLRLEAVRQLELCLTAPFTGVLPHGHGSVQSIVDALCDVLMTYVRDGCNGDDLTNDVLCGSVAMAAMIPLARLRIAHNGHAVLLERTKVTQLIPEEALRQTECQPLLHFDEWHSDRRNDLGFCDGDDGPTVTAPFTYVLMTRLGSSSADEVVPDNREDQITRRSRKVQREGAAITLRPLISSICHVLHLSSAKFAIESNPEGPGLLEPMQCLFSIRLLCYRVMIGLMECGLPVDLSNEPSGFFSGQNSQRNGSHGAMRRQRTPDSLGISL